MKLSAGREDNNAKENEIVRAMENRSLLCLLPQTGKAKALFSYVPRMLATESS
jgi:hypothetical protein